MEMYRSYVKQIQKYALLDYDQEIALSKRIENGDKDALQQLIQANLRLVVSVAKKFTMARSCIMDLIQEGNLALMAAAEKYHYSFATRFSTYAYAWIMQYMLRYLNNKTSMITIPHRKDELLRRVTSARQVFVQKTGTEPSIAELASYLNVTENDVRTVLSYEYRFTSLDAECKADGRTTVGEMLPDATFDPERELLCQESKAHIAALLETLPKKEQWVIRSRYNFDYDLHAKTLRELSSDLGVSTETIRQMEIRAVRRMKQAISAYPVEELFTA